MVDRKAVRSAGKMAAAAAAAAKERCLCVCVRETAVVKRGSIPDVQEHTDLTRDVICNVGVLCMKLLCDGT